MPTSKQQKNIGKNTRKKKSSRSIDYKKSFFKDLKDPGYAAGYPTAALEEGEDVFLLAIRDVVQAFGGMSILAQATQLNRENLYNMLSTSGNPRLSSITTVLDTLGFEIKLVPKNTSAA